MRVLICPDKFAGTLSAPEAAEAIASGWRSIRPDDRLDARPLADGGPGTIEVLDAALPGRRIPTPTRDPLGRTATGEVLLAGDTAYVESAQACGLHLLDAAERDPKRTTSYGLGLLVAAAADTGARTVVVGLGGSATNDAGAGMLTALGLTPVDRAGLALPYGGAALADCASITGAPRLRGVRLIAATDVDSPLLGPDGASAVFGPQKGADDTDVAVLDHALGVFADVLARDLPGCPPGLVGMPGAGAAGGIGAGMFAVGAVRESGAELVCRAVELDAAATGSDLVITGEGSFDHQSLRGKLVSRVAGAAGAAGVPCVVLAGRVAVGRPEAGSAGISAALALTEHFGSVEEAMARPAQGLRELGAALAERWSR